jgi:aminoglycoside 2''-phosphotransferase
MSELLAPYVAQIRADFPTLEIASARLNRDGVVNDVVIVNDEFVFRFAKSEEGRALLAHEAQVLSVIGRHVSAPVPQFTHRTATYGHYRLVPGTPLYRHLLLRSALHVQEQLACDLANFLAQLHAVPLDEMPTHPRSGSQLAASRRTIYEQRLAALEQDVFPLLWADQKAWIYDLYAPVLEDKVDLDSYTPRLIHRDLASYHILHNPQSGRLAGVIDFGMAGLGDPASDWACLINTYGESFVRRMHATYQLEQATLDRARFLAGSLELEWALIGVQDKDSSMLLVHIGRARDSQPLLTHWS